MVPSRSTASISNRSSLQFAPDSILGGELGLITTTDDVRDLAAAVSEARLKMDASHSCLPRAPR